MSEEEHLERLALAYQALADAFGRIAEACERIPSAPLSAEDGALEVEWARVKREMATE